jgi:hypothetical protein
MAIPHDLNFKFSLPSTGEREIQHKKTNPVNGSSFTSSNTHSEFRIGGGQVNRFADGNSMYIKASFVTALANTGFVKYGTDSAISRLIVESTSGAVICDINNYHVLKRIKVVESGDTDYINNDGVIMQGMSPDGDNVDIEVARTFIIPLEFMSLDQYIPLFGVDGLVIKAYWATALDFILEDTGSTNLAATSVTISSVELNYDTIELTDASMEQLFADTGGKFILQNSAYIRTGTVVAAATEANIPLGIGRSKVRRLYACLRNLASAAHADDRGDRLNMSISTLTSSYLEVDGTKLNDKTLTFGPSNTAEVLMQLRKMRDIPVTVKGSSIRVPAEFQTVVAQTAATRPNIFYWGFDLMDGTDNRLTKSGLNLKGNQNVQMNVAASAAASGTIDIFAEYENTIVLDMSAEGDRLFTVFN